MFLITKYVCLCFHLLQWNFLKNFYYNTVSWISLYCAFFKDKSLNIQNPLFSKINNRKKELEIETYLLVPCPMEEGQRQAEAGTPCVDGHRYDTQTGSRLHCIFPISSS